MWRWTLGLTLLLAIFSHPGFAEDHVGPVEVKAAIERGKEALLRNLPRYRADPEFGFRILAVMALLNCGYPASDPAIVETVAEITRNAGFITNEQYGGT